MLTSSRLLRFAAFVAAASASCGGARSAEVVLVAPLAIARQQEHESVDMRSGELTAHAPACPFETHWDGLACVHARATCGGWDGLSCDPSSASPPEQDRSARGEFARIDGEARTVCPEDDESRQVFSGNAPDIVKGIAVAIARADEINQRLTQLRDAHQTPEWEVATIARMGSLYDCLWNSLRQSTPVYFTPRQQALLAKLNNIRNMVSRAGVGPQAQQIQLQIANTQQAVAEKWRNTRDTYLAALETKMVRSYVTATILARRYGLEGFTFTRACKRLPLVASILGNEKMARSLERMADPTDPEPDPEKRRHLTYVVGAFDAAR